MNTLGNSAAPSYRALLDDATKTLYEQSDTPRIDAEVLMQHLLQRPLAWLIAYGETTATADHIQGFYELIEQRRQGQPIAYLAGSREFWTLSLMVNEHVLIPRPDTETLVEQALERISKTNRSSVLDLGTGSGAIALSIAKERPSTLVTAVDSQSAALDVARRNAEQNAVENVQFLESSWYQQLSHEARFDLIASNPPYVAADDPHLNRGDLRFEPSSALVAEQDGLSDLIEIITNAPPFLKPQGHLIVEHGHTQAAVVAQLFEQNGFNNVQLYRDINDLPRCTAGELTA